MFIILPISLVHIWLESISRVTALILVVPMTAAYCAYSIYCHGKYGKTIGKHVMQIRITRLSGERIGWRESWLRSSVDIIFAVLSVIASLIALVAITDAQYYDVTWIQRSRNLESLQPSWSAWVMTATSIWMWSEIIVMLCNERRRALHDYIAGTVVISDKRPKGTLPSEVQR